MPRSGTQAGGRRKAAPLRVLLAASEVYPLVKTGGLADVAHALPVALKKLGVDVRVFLPAYRDVLEKANEPAPVAQLDVPGGPARVWQGTLPGTRIPVYLLDAPALYDRAGTPYEDAGGREWPDNAVRFGLFCRAIAALCGGVPALEWRPDVLHCNDWHTGLAPALLAGGPDRPGMVFTVHNVAYQGNFPRETLDELQLPAALWTPELLEFYGRLSFIKGGLACADRITTVSPTHAREMLTPEFGFGLEGLVQMRRDALTGILNGVDYGVWNPGRDPEIACAYSRTRLQGKRKNKLALQYELGLEVEGDAPVAAHIARLTWQKGSDLLLEALPRLLRGTSLQVVVLGSGDAALQAALEAAAAQWPGRVGVRLGYDETLAHRIQAGADMMVLPSRFEPCGLTHLYSLRYGTVPVVHATGGMVDTVVDATQGALQDGTATGFLFGTADASALCDTMERALELWDAPLPAWQALMRTGMAQEFSWARSAASYLALYQDLLAGRTPHGR